MDFKFNTYCLNGINLQIMSINTNTATFFYSDELVFQN